MSSGSAPTAQSNSTQGPAPYMYPYIGTGLSQAGSLLQSGGPQYYPGNTVADFSKPQQQAMSAIFKTGMNGSPALTAAQGFDQTLLQSGGGSNPYLDQMYSQAAGATQNQLSGEFAGMGRNAAAAQPLRAQQLNNLATSMYGGQYQNNIQNALAAGNQAQSLYGTQMQGLQAAEGVGQQVQDQAQKKIDANKDRFDYYQNLPWQTARSYDALLSGLQGGQSQSSPVFGNPTGQALGNASTAASLFEALGWL